MSDKPDIMKAEPGLPDWFLAVSLIPFAAFIGFCLGCAVGLWL